MVDPLEPVNDELAELRAGRRRTATLVQRCNTSALIAPVAQVDVAVETGPVDTESARVTSGDHPQLVTVDVDDAVVGLTICYDPRFPELYLALAPSRGAADPDRPAGLRRADRARPLGRPPPRAGDRERRLRAGALADRWPAGSAAYGRSIIVDPWGTVIAQAPDAVGIIRAELDLERVGMLRRQIPVLVNRCPDAYDPEAGTPSR